MNPVNLQIPPVIMGTSSLGNLYEALTDDVKLSIVEAWFKNATGQVVFDSAGKYGAGLALESLGTCLKKLNIKPEQVVISNKLGWYRTPLTTPEPTFEPGVWQNIQHDAVQVISYEGMMSCFEQGNSLLGGYIPQLVSVHDPDEYLATAKNAEDEEKLFMDILDAYRALADLKNQGKVSGIGVGAKNWKVIKRISSEVKLDWVMFANSFTLHHHPKELEDFMQQLQKQQVVIINSAVFNAGFLIGGRFYNYKLIDEHDPVNQELINWRKTFFAVCQEFKVKPAHACIQFGLNAPGVASIALSTSNPERVKENLDMAGTKLPISFWEALVQNSLVRPDYNIL